MDESAHAGQSMQMIAWGSRGDLPQCRWLGLGVLRAGGWAALSFPFSFQTFAHASVTGISHQCIWSCSVLHVVGRWVVACMESPQQGGPVLTPAPALSSCFSEFHIFLSRLRLHPYHHQLSPLLEKQPKRVASCQPRVAFPEVRKFQEETLEAGLTSK